MTRETLFDNESTTIQLSLATSAPVSSRSALSSRRTLVITFAEMQMNDPSRPGFGEVMLNKNGFDVLSVQKRGESWYQDLSLEDFHHAAKKVTARYECVKCYGVSMGAYAALYYSGCIAASFFAISPLASVDPRYPSLRGGAFRDFTGWHHLRLDAVPKSRGNDLIFFDPTLARDRLYMEGEVLPAFPEAKIYRIPRGGHPVARAMVEMGLLPSLLFSWLREEPLLPPAGITRGRKGSSETYKGNLRDACMVRERTRRPVQEALQDRRQASECIEQTA